MPLIFRTRRMNIDDRAKIESLDLNFVPMIEITLELT